MNTGLLVLKRAHPRARELLEATLGRADRAGITGDGRPPRWGCAWEQDAMIHARETERGFKELFGPSVLFLSFLSVHLFFFFLFPLVTPMISTFVF